MTIQNCLDKDRRITQVHFPYGKEFFLENNVDTVEVKRDGKKSYVHFDGEGVETFNTKCAFRRALSQETGGAWIEERAGRKRYFIDDSGWLRGSCRQVTKEECLNKLEAPTTLQKVLGLGLGILALAPGFTEFARLIPFGSEEAALGLLVMQQKSSALGILGCRLISSQVDAQPVGTEFQVNTNTANDQTLPAISRLMNGGFIVVWQSNNQDGDEEGIFGQQYDSLGEVVGAEFQVNTRTEDSQRYPVVSGLKEGGFVVVWDSFAQDGDLWGVFGQRFSENGTAVGPEFQANTYTTSDQKFCNVASLENGGFAVFWNSQLQDGSGSGIFGQKYDAEGLRDGNEFLVNTYTSSNQPDPNAAGFSDGGFVVTWESFGQDGDSWGVFGQRYIEDGASGAEFQVNTYVVNSQASPSVVVLEGGRFVVAWQSIGQDGDQGGIYRRIFGSSGIPEENEIRVNDYTENGQGAQAVETTGDGGFLVVWHSDRQDGDGYGIFGKRYNGSGVNLTSDFQINTYSAGNQVGPEITSLQNGDFVVVWQSDSQDGNLSGVFGQRFDLNGNPIPLTYQPSSSSGSLLAKSSDAGTASTQSSSSNSMDSSVSTSTPFVTSNTETRFSEKGVSTISRIAYTLSETPSNSRPTVTIHSIYDIEYGESYSITQNGQVIGSYSISGGTGLYSSGNLNVLEIQLDPNFEVEEGVAVTLFSVPTGEEPQWEDVILSGGDESSCITAEGVFVEDQDEHSYQVVFSLELDSCNVNAESSTLLGKIGAGLIANN